MVEALWCFSVLWTNIKTYCFLSYKMCGVLMLFGFSYCDSVLVLFSACATVMVLSGVLVLCCNHLQMQQCFGVLLVL